ncbi:M23 family metallopeptidase [Streptomyces gobiensis]|uniref:M23 family metallopeptidase n=1 Tax=Streptomyces gobiensis TaxID=2875706 RepID=UPI001E53D21A|nr:M23 family metallopeptidase [Streptomyces gobiensis]UGY92101.1 M23 family metallopeptidase [Streptomyces gobiensis]
MRKMSMVVARWGLVVFFAQLVAKFFFDLSWLWTLIPLGLAMALTAVGNWAPTAPGVPRRGNVFKALSYCCWAAFFALFAAGFYVDVPYWWGWVPLGLAIALGAVASQQPTAPAAGEPGAPQPVEVAPPVTGRWSALNSPADKVPSHGTHGCGQAYAIDIVAEPEGQTRPGFGWWPIARRNRDFPAFGAPLLAVADATVVRAVDSQRDHLSRNSFPALLYLFLVEALFRQMGGPGRVFGNRVILDLGDGTYAAYAHVQRGSLAVREGDRVRAGQLLGRCGNSGNSTEPHVHFQLMDSPDLDVARGVPFSWRGAGVPVGGEVFTVGEATLALSGKPLTG